MATWTWRGPQLDKKVRSFIFFYSQAPASMMMEEAVIVKQSPRRRLKINWAGWSVHTKHASYHHTATLGLPSCRSRGFGGCLADVFKGGLQKLASDSRALDVSICSHTLGDLVSFLGINDTIGVVF